MQLAEEVIRLFPEYLRFKWKDVAGMGEALQEIRLRCERPVMIYARGEEWYLDRSGRLTREIERAQTLSRDELSQILKHICRYSLYAYEDEMSRGYMSADGGFRVGIAGEVILNPDGSVKNVRYISSLNIRIAHEARGAAARSCPGSTTAGGWKTCSFCPRRAAGKPPCCGTSSAWFPTETSALPGRPWAWWMSGRRSPAAFRAFPETMWESGPTCWTAARREKG